jgi:ligand-binding sensor domain-containing protein
MHTDVRIIESRSCCTRWMNRIPSKVLVGFFLIQVCMLPSSFALDPQKAISQYTHTNWQIDDGLPQNAVQCITQTRDGFLWLGTQEGLVRFDGVKFTVFDRTNTQGINNNSFQSLIQTADGNIWAGTQGGLTRIVQGRFITYTNADGLANDNVYGLYEDVQNNLWIATGGGGLNVWKDGKFKNFSTKDGLAHNFITSVTGGKDGTIYIGSMGGMTKYSNGKFITYNTADGLINDNVLSLFLDSDNVLWVGTVAGLCRFKNGKWITFTTKNGLTNDRVRSILKDHDGNLWLGTDGGGINRMRDSRFSYYSINDGLIDGYVWTFFEDNERNLWVGTVGGGLHSFHDGKFMVYGEKEGLSQDNTRAIYETRNGSVWVGSDNRGLTRFKDGALTTYTTTFAQASFGARAISEGPDGSLWVGTYGGGLCRFKDGIWITYTTKNGLANDRIFGLFMAKDNTLWIGTRGGGLCTLKDGKFKTYTTNDGLTNNEVRTILEASDGSIWICTSSGLNRLKGGKLTSYTTKDGLSYNIIYTIFEDESKALWIGTYGGGLNRYKDGRFTIYTTKQGMYDNTVFQILEDKQKNFWLTCNRGIYRVSEKELNDFADGKIQSVHCTVFGTVDGMRSAKCNGSSQPAGMRAHDGKLWFPTMKGVAIIDPESIQQSTIPPPVFIERALFDKQEVPIDSIVQLGPGHGDLEIHYPALSYSAPKQVNFKYMLVGFDKDWIDAGARRVAYYTNLPPGNFQFKVIACNNAGVWNWNGVKIRVNLLAHFYQTNWFRGLMILLVILIGFGAYRLRVWQLLENEKELKKRVDESLAKIKILGGLIPICASCKKIRNDKGYWSQLEEYINEHSEATFSHGVCPECAEKLYGGYLAKMKKQQEGTSS